MFFFFSYKLDQRSNGKTNMRLEGTKLSAVDVWCHWAGCRLEPISKAQTIALTGLENQKLNQAQFQLAHCGSVCTIQRGCSCATLGKNNRAVSSRRKAIDSTLRWLQIEAVVVESRRTRRQEMQFRGSEMTGDLRGQSYWEWTPTIRRKGGVDIIEMTCRYNLSSGLAWRECQLGFQNPFFLSFLAYSYIFNSHNIIIL